MTISSYNSGTHDLPDVGLRPYTPGTWRVEYPRWNRPKAAGSLGSELLEYQRIRSHRVQIVTALDIDPEKIGQIVHGTRVNHLSGLPDRGLNAPAQLGSFGAIRAIAVVPAPRRLPPFESEINYVQDN
jgi:hypothetical protein